MKLFMLIGLLAAMPTLWESRMPVPPDAVMLGQRDTKKHESANMVWGLNESFDGAVQFYDTQLQRDCYAKCFKETEHRILEPTLHIFNQEVQTPAGNLFYVIINDDPAKKYKLLLTIHMSVPRPTRELKRKIKQ